MHPTLVGAHRARPLFDHFAPLAFSARSITGRPSQIGPADPPMKCGRVRAGRLECGYAAPFRTDLTVPAVCHNRPRDSGCGAAELLNQCRAIC
jgi:hypothetical protein